MDTIQINEDDLCDLALELGVERPELGNDIHDRVTRMLGALSAVELLANNPDRKGVPIRLADFSGLLEQVVQDGRKLYGVTARLARVLEGGAR